VRELRYRTVHEDLIAALPALRRPYERLFSDWDDFDGEPPGQYIVFPDTRGTLLQVVLTLDEGTPGRDALLRRALDFVETLENIRPAARRPSASGARGSTRVRPGTPSPPHPDWRTRVEHGRGRREAHTRLQRQAWVADALAPVRAALLAYSPARRTSCSSPHPRDEASGPGRADAGEGSGRPDQPRSGNRPYN
jgi:hypothetical protein